VPAGGRRGSSARGGHTPAHPPELHTRPASRPPGLSVIPPLPATVCAISHVRSPHSTGPGQLVSIDASNERRTGKPTLPSIRNDASNHRGESSVPGTSAGRYTDRNAHPGSGLALAFELGVQGDRRHLRVSCLEAPRAGVQGSIDVAHRQAAGTSLRRARASDLRISNDEQAWCLDRPDVLKKPVLALPFSSFTLVIGAGIFTWFATIFACSSYNP
jgi:hypothetical protein